MDLALLSILAFALAILLSSFTSINVGLVSIALAFFVGVSLGGMAVGEVVSGFPSNLFLMLVGVTLLFGQAMVNGTLDRIAKRSVKLARGHSGVIPLIFFGLAMLLASIGAGNIAATAMLAPIAMSVAGRAGISVFLMIVMVVTGASAGALSPFSPTGVIANGVLARIGITGEAWSTFYNNLIAEGFVGLMAFFLLGGKGLLARVDVTAPIDSDDEPWSLRQKLTLAVLACWILAVLFLELDIGMAAFFAATVLTLFRAADEQSAVKAIPWGTVLMVSGVTVLISILERTGGMDLFTGLLARLASTSNITGVMAFVTGVISVYASSSGVVLPGFLPTIPGLVDKLGGGDPIAIAASVNVGAHLVDVSPLSTLGALCIAAAPASENRTVLFNKMLLWGLAMSLVGAVVCYLFFGVLGLA